MLVDAQQITADHVTGTLRPDTANEIRKLQKLNALSPSSYGRVDTPTWRCRCATAAAWGSTSERVEREDLEPSVQQVLGISSPDSSSWRIRRARAAASAATATSSGRSER